MSTTIFPPVSAVKSNSQLSMRFQTRDEELLNTIYEYGGVVAKRQLKDLFWPDKSSRAMEKRLSKLHLGEYLAWPAREDWRLRPITESVCWLAWRGALLVGQSRGLQVDALNKANENQIRRLDILLRRQGFHWMREPRWIQLGHDLNVVDFRLRLEKALRDTSLLTLGEWLHEGVFRSRTDVVEYELEGSNGSMRKVKKGVCPDAYFVIEDEQRKRAGQPYRARFLLELDNATHDNPSFGLEKALPGAAYINSVAYKQRFGHNSGRWLVVTTAGERRLENLMRQTEERLGNRAELFYFATLEQLKVGNLIRSDIWLQAGSRKTTPLIS